VGERMSTPPSLATSGNTWPGARNRAAAVPLASAAHVLLRSSAEMPVVRAVPHVDRHVKAVPSAHR